MSWLLNSACRGAVDEGELHDVLKAMVPRILLLLALCSSGTFIWATTVTLGDEVPLSADPTAPVLPAQSDPSIATDGVEALAVWSEYRFPDRYSRIHGVRLDRLGQVIGSPMVLAVGGASDRWPEVTYGGGRYLLTWIRDGATIGRFVRTNGELDGNEFGIARMAQHHVLREGPDFWVLWSEDGAIHTRRVADSGVVTVGPLFQGEGAVTLADVVAGAVGEIAVLYRQETSSSAAMKVAKLRVAWSGPLLLAQQPRPCPSLACIDSMPLAIGWNGSDYVATWVYTEGSGRHAWLESTRVGSGATNRLAFVSSYPFDIAGDMLWAGSNFVVAYRIRGINPSRSGAGIARLAADGTPLDVPVYGVLLHDNARERETTSVPDLVLLSDRRAIVVYARQEGAFPVTSPRVFARTVDFRFPRRRAVSR